VSDRTPTPPPACLDSPDWRRHCWHFPRDIWQAGYSYGPEAPWTLTCCDCGMEAESHTLNRRMGTHGPHRTGEAMTYRQHRLQPLIRVLPRGES
jgi:hypothetical protein